MNNSQARVKICGLSREVDIEAVNQFGADFAGFIFWPRSKRFVTVEKAAALKKLLSPQIKAVGVFVDSPVEAVAAIAEAGIIDMIQLHGKEDGKYIAKLRSFVDCPIIKALKVGSIEDILEADRSKADYILLDNGTGTGHCFDWAALEAVENQLKHSYFLAGGLSEANLPEAMRKFHPYVFDINSGVETDGLKDAKKIERCIALVKGR